MNNSLVKRSCTAHIPDLPELDVQKRRAIVTKHFTNLIMYLPTDEACFLSWLVYNIQMDNTFVYSGPFIRRYTLSIVEANKRYNGRVGRKPNNLHTTTNAGRRLIVSLVEKGYIFNLENNKFMVNPMLTYHSVVPAKDYIGVMRGYQMLDVDDWVGVCAWCKNYVELVKSKI